MLLSTGRNAILVDQVSLEIVKFPGRIISFKLRRNTPPNDIGDRDHAFSNPTLSSLKMKRMTVVTRATVFSSVGQKALLFISREEHNPSQNDTPPEDVRVMMMHSSVEPNGRVGHSELRNGCGIKINVGPSK
ncbi:hypothetical protein CDAR_43911 [Caerostris darwini]|uniref:Uncharacterized protein n=1 Tax=Caerostris darwini TaxID=1538125 RepID=A0AAV4WHZ6_9ARAC|nr:hypothetical protein CDAR_43911 [Caerostris darwini]